MDDNLAAVVVTAVLSGSILLGLLGRAIFTTMRRPKGPTSETPSVDRFRAIEERLSNLQQSVDAIAVEVERVSEGQRFTTRLLSDRSERVERN